MSFNAKVVVPSPGVHVIVEYNWPDGYKLVNTYMDEPGNRYHIAFLEATDGAAAGSIKITMDSIDPNGDFKHSLSAILVSGNTVVARDRKLVKDATPEGP